MMTAIIDALTKPLTEKEKFAGKPPEAIPEKRLLAPDTEDNLQQLFKDKDWTDYLPIILPTEERVAAMLKGTSQKPDKVVKVLSWPGGARALTVEKAAVCAVMAGAKPEHFPLVLAVSMSLPFGNSTTSMANMILVNGPIRNQVKMNYGGNAMGPHNEVNAVLGRSLPCCRKLREACMPARPPSALLEATSSTTTSASRRTKKPFPRDGIRFMCRWVSSLRIASSPSAQAGPTFPAWEKCKGPIQRSI